MEIIKNYLKYSLWFVLIVFAVLLGLHWLPALTIDGHTMRRVDLLSDLRYPESETAAADSDSIPLPPVVKPAFVDTCRTGMTCIEDYSDSTLRGMTPFYKALDRVSSDDSDDKQVRIAVFGDSFIEADIFTADLREMLQKQFGGCGVGFVTITSMTSGYRPTVRHTFGGWSSHAVTDSVYFDKKKQGISGHYFVPRNGAYVELRGQNKYASLRLRSPFCSCEQRRKQELFIRPFRRIAANSGRRTHRLYPLDSRPCRFYIVLWFGNGWKERNHSRQLLVAWQFRSFSAGHSSTDVETV